MPDHAAEEDFWNDEVIQIIRDVHALPGFAGFSRAPRVDGGVEYTIIFNRVGPTKA